MATVTTWVHSLEVPPALSLAVRVSTRTHMVLSLTPLVGYTASYQLFQSLLQKTPAGGARLFLVFFLDHQIPTAELFLDREMAAVKLNTTLIIVIAASGLIGCVIILFLIFRCCRRPKSAPLPPIQPLAHHREKEFDHPPHLHIHRSSVGLTELGLHGSDASLLKPGFQTDEPNGTPSSSHYSLSIPPSPPANAIY